MLEQASGGVWVDVSCSVEVAQRFNQVSIPAGEAMGELKDLEQELLVWCRIEGANFELMRLGPNLHVPPQPKPLL